MKTSIKTAILFSFTFLLSCVKGPTNYGEFLNKQLNDYYKEEFNLYNNIVIIPRSGCHTCKDYADFYFNENKDRKDFLFIFTKLISRKQLKIEFGEEALNKKNVKIDSNNLFYNIDYIDSAYPLLLKKNQEGKFTYSLLE